MMAVRRSLHQFMLDFAVCLAVFSFCDFERKRNTNYCIKSRTSVIVHLPELSGRDRAQGKTYVR